jgi:hypothetical protein
VIDRGALQRALDRRGVNDWTIIDRDQELALVDEATRVYRAEHRRRWQIIAHIDTPKGRGSSYISVDAVDGNPEWLADQAVALAQASLGPAWASTPSAAPARVALLDDHFGKLAPIDAAAEALRAVRPSGATVTANARYLREQVTALSRGGFHTAWQAGLVDVSAIVASGDHAFAVDRSARRRDELDLEHALADAASDAAALATAGAPQPGPCPLVLSGDVLVAAWQVFAHQADAVVERQGLTRYREHMPVARGADQISEPLTIVSDGALDFGVLSAPLGADGDAVREFRIIDRGVAVGLGLSPREAALRGKDPNGGVRNLVVTTGTWSGDAPKGAVEIVRTRDFAIEPYTGDASLEIALARRDGGYFAGGMIRLDLIAALALAHRHAQQVRTGNYVGPSSVLVESAYLLA